MEYYVLTSFLLADSIGQDGLRISQPFVKHHSHIL